MNMCLLEVAMCGKCRSSHFQSERGGSKKVWGLGGEVKTFYDWGVTFAGGGGSVPHYMPWLTVWQLQTFAYSSAGKQPSPKMLCRIYEMLYFSLPFNSVIVFSHCPYLFSLLTPIPTYFSIVFLLEGLCNPIYIHTNKMDVFVWVNHDIYLRPVIYIISITTASFQRT